MATLLTTYPPQAADKDIVMAALLSGISVPAEITSSLTKSCYTIVSANEAILVGQAMIAITDNPENSRQFSETMWRRLTLIASEPSWLSNLALAAVIESTKAAPDMWTHLLDIAKRSATRITHDAFRHIYTRIMGTFSPEIDAENFRELFRKIPAHHRTLVTELAIESPKPTDTSSPHWSPTSSQTQTISVFKRQIPT